MENYQCIAIGIDRYHFFPPLNFAEASARILYQCLVEQAKISVRQALLLTDASPRFLNRSTYPNRKNLISWLEIRNSPSSSSLWFFFSGYGISYQGEDYLMPIDGNLKDIPGTGIAMRSLFESLIQQRAARILVVLDLRGMEDAMVGQQAIALAKQMKISLIVSSHGDKSASLGRGMLATALVEALRHYRQNITLAKLEQYLRDRLPEFSLDLWRPTQTPVVISPSPEASHYPLLEKAERDRMPMATFSSSRTLFPQPISLKRATADSPMTTKVAAIALPKLPDRPAFYSPLNINLPSNNNDDKRANIGIKADLSPIIIKISQFKWFFFGLASSLLPSLLTIVVVFQLLQMRQPTSISEQAAEILETETPIQAGSKSEQEILNRATIFLKANQASDFNRAIGSVRQLKPGDPFYQQARADIDRWSQIILDIAEGRARTGDFQRAIAAAELVPRDRASLSQTARQKIRLWETLQKQQQATKAAIETARKLINPSQAATYSRAIALLRQIPPEQPGYMETRQFMNNWSQKIYFLAISHAAEGNLGQAIETAQFIPSDTHLYQDAQKAIARWKQKSKARWKIKK
ncbi:hypothetical protein NIES593_15675 [Hydrococcus rivularis NIES-593]|uniref:Peptidase C14 caspase domain-containing protein n=1 Tax=Hydrococcus rivularis NIES-593 TaxID=1921803 RepID=A0A1U7HCX6_9CYAN|nr:caspase family protein [Hydrococcus rivularis]OKH21433.1 hypothetical protein NIES593_15675 [Hydrococcus rivularis NIES-593]